MAVLSNNPGHVSPADTYWYQSLACLALARRRPHRPSIRRVIARMFVSVTRVTVTRPFVWDAGAAGAERHAG